MEKVFREASSAASDLYEDLKGSGLMTSLPPGLVSIRPLTGLTITQGLVCQ